jgi:hypothetical protein
MPTAQKTNDVEVAANLAAISILMPMVWAGAGQASHGRAVER